MAVKRRRPLSRGDVILVEWLDITESATDDPDRALPHRRKTIGFYWDRQQHHGKSALVTTTTLDDEHTAQNGYCVYPEGCILKVSVIRRAVTL